LASSLAISVLEEHISSRKLDLLGLNRYTLLTAYCLQFILRTT